MGVLSAEEPVRRPRLQDVATEAGVSTASASLVLRGAPGPSDATRQRVVDAAARLGYRPDRTASSLARRRSGLLGVLVDVHSSFHADLVDELDAAAQGAGFDLVLSTVTPARDEARAIETLVDFRCEAVVLLGPEAPPYRLARLGSAMPVVVMGRRIPSAVADVVRTADADGVAQAVAHLAGLGHRDIAYVDGGRGTISADRRRGYRTAMHRLGLAAHARVLPGDHTEAAGMAAAHALLREDTLPTAFVTFNDRSAIGLMDVLTRAGISVPGQVSVVGFDDSPQSRWAHIELTTVSQDAGEQARHAVAAIMERRNGRHEPREIVLPPHLVVRASTGTAPES